MQPQSGEVTKSSADLELWYLRSTFTSILLQHHLFVLPGDAHGLIPGCGSVVDSTGLSFTADVSSVILICHLSSGDAAGVTWTRLSCSLQLTLCLFAACPETCTGTVWCGVWGVVWCGVWGVAVSAVNVSSLE